MITLLMIYYGSPAIILAVGPHTDLLSSNKISNFIQFLLSDSRSTFNSAPSSSNIESGGT